MTPQSKARLVALVALPLLAANLGWTFPAPATAASVTQPQRMPHISIEELGPRNRPTVILIPGLSTPATVWTATAPMLAKDHHVLVVQVNGFGGDDPGANLTDGLLPGAAADLQAYLASHKIASADVIGHSMGGLIALMLAKAHPANIRRLMIVDSLPFIGDLFAPGATVAMLEPQARAMRDAMAAKPVDTTSAQGTAARLALKSDSRAQLVAWMTKADPRVTARAFYEDMTTDLRPDMARVAAPITLVYPGAPTGDDAGGQLYHRAYAAAPHVTFVPVPDSAHFVMLDQPAAFAQAVTTFLK